MRSIVVGSDERHTVKNKKEVVSSKRVEAETSRKAVRVVRLPTGRPDCEKTLS